MNVTRRYVIWAGATVGALAARWLAASPGAAAQGTVAAPAVADETDAILRDLLEAEATPSPRVRLVMPSDFPTGFTVPLDLQVDSAMTADEHVRSVRIFAPRNPIVEVVRFGFAPGRTPARVTTRIRLAAPQYVVAVAEMSDGRLLSGRTFVSVATNGCG